MTMTVSSSVRSLCGGQRVFRKVCLIAFFLGQWTEEHLATSLKDSTWLGRFRNPKHEIMHLPRTRSPRFPNKTNIHRLAVVEYLLSGLLARCPAAHPLRAEQRVGETGFLCTRHLHFQGIGMIHTAYHVRVKADIPQSLLLSASDSADDTLQRVTWVHWILLQILAASRFQSLKSTSALRASIFNQHSFVSNRSYLTCSYLLRTTCAILAGACMFADIYSPFGQYPAKRMGPTIRGPF